MAFGDDYSEQTGQPDDEQRRRRMEEFIVRSALKPTIPNPEPALKQPNTQYRGSTGATPTSHPSKGPQDPYGQTGYSDNEAPVRPQFPRIEANRGPGPRTMRGSSGASSGNAASLSDDNDELVRRAGGMNESGATTTPRMPALGTSRPNIPTPRTSETPSPDINANAPWNAPWDGRRALGGNPQVLGLNRGVQPQPLRPNVQPLRSDFPERKLPGWEKALGIAAAPFVPGVTEAIFSGPRREAERQYESAAKDWTLGQESAERQARTAETQARTRALNNPPEKTGQTPEETTLADLMSGGPGGGPQINPDTGKPYTRLEAFGKVEQTKTGAATAAKQPPLDPATVSQMNDAHTLRYQQLNPGKPLPAALTLRPGSTQQDYERIHQNLTSMESSAGVQAQREATNASRAEAQRDREDREALQPVIALDPKSKQRVFSSMGEAKQNGWQVTTLKPNEEKEGELVAQLNDVQLNTSRYRAALNALKGNISQQSVNHMARILSDPATNSAIAQNLGMGSLASIMEQGSRARDWNELQPEEQNALIGFIRMRGAALAYQKVLTNQGRTSKEGLDIELQNMPSPILGASVGNKQLDAFQENIDTASQRAVKLPWMETAKDVRARIEKQAEQQSNEQKTAPTKPTKPELRRPVSVGQE